MSKVGDGDTSDDDIFIVKQIKPVNKLTLQQALIIKHTVLKSFHSNGNKKKKKNKDKKLDIEQKQKKKKDNGKSKEVSKADKAKKNSSRSFCFDPEIEIIEDSVKEKSKKNKLKGIKREYSTEKCLREELNGDKLSMGTENKNTLSGEKVKKSKDSLEKQKSKEGNLRKRTEYSPESCETRKKFKNCAVDSMSSEASKQKENEKSLSDGMVKLHQDESSANKMFPKEFLSDGSRSLEVSPEVGKNEINFEEFSPTQVEDMFGWSWSFNEEEQEEVYKNNSELLCFSFKKIISSETKKQIELEQQSCLNGRAMQKLFSENECEVFEKFFQLEDRACKLFVRMLIRKRTWHRVSNISYADIDKNLEKYFEILEKVNFVDVNIESEDFATQLNLLNKPEIIKLCKAFNVYCKSHNSAKKEALIISLIEECKKQKSVLDIIKGKNCTHRESLLGSALKQNLGMCIRINKETFKTFHKILVLSSFPHYFDDEEKRFNNELYMYIKVFKNIIKFPNYKLTPFVVFETQTDLEEYVTSLALLSNFEKAVANKNHDEFISTVQEVKKSFENILSNQEYHKRLSSLPTFLKKFNAGTVYARILTKYCQTFKRKTSHSDIVQTVKLLLSQKLFLQRKRGDWYEILSKALESSKENNKAAEVIIGSLKDSSINEVQRLSLQLRGQGILKKKNHGVTDALLREVLDDFCILSVQEPASIEIKGKALEGNEFGVKCVYVQDTGYGKKYTSVEERAIIHYKSHGFTKGYHVEGFIVHSIYFLLFFDIIYGLSPEGVFQSPYQQIPLDFNSSHFYLNRKDEIDALLADMLTWDDKKVESVIKDVYWKNCDTVCVISWDKEFTPELFCEVIKCITMPILVLILERLARNFRVYRSGFPDLTLWDPKTNKIKFVEVKSPNDRLSPAQRIWLNFLRNIGLSSEVCNVKNLSGRNFD